jgi:hypothetical protein
MKLRHLPVVSALSALAALSLGCSAIPVKMHTETHIQHADGTATHESSDWEGTLDELPEQLGKAGSQLGDVTAKMAKELTDVPPPGTVELKDLAPALAKYQGRRGADFLVSAKDDKGKPISFSYVRLGVPEYDEFFKTSQEIHALVYQATQVIGQMRLLSSKLTGTKIDASANLSAEVDKALHADADASLVGNLRAMQEMAQALASLVPQLVNKVGKLVSAGEALVASAATSLTNPKVVTHLDLVKDGLVTSVKVIKESGVLMVDLSKSLSGFGKG